MKRCGRATCQRAARRRRHLRARAAAGRAPRAGRPGRPGAPGLATPPAWCFHAPAGGRRAGGACCPACGRTGRGRRGAPRRSGAAAQRSSTHGRAGARGCAAAPLGRPPCCAGACADCLRWHPGGRSQRRRGTLRPFRPMTRSMAENLGDLAASAATRSRAAQPVPGALVSGHTPKYACPHTRPNVHAWPWQAAAGAPVGHGLRAPCTGTMKRARCKAPRRQAPWPAPQGSRPPRAPVPAPSRAPSPRALRKRRTRAPGPRLRSAR